jgi:hypothetical protein
MGKAPALSSKLGYVKNQEGQPLMPVTRRGRSRQSTSGGILNGSPSAVHQNDVPTAASEPFRIVPKMQLFGSTMTFVYHCFDRIVINRIPCNAITP